MKLTSQQEDAMDAKTVVNGPAWPWGEECPSCGRPHYFTYTDGAKVCDKCNEAEHSKTLPNQ